MLEPGPGLYGPGRSREQPEVGAGSGVQKMRWNNSSISLAVAAAVFLGAQICPLIGRAQSRPKIQGRDVTVDVQKILNAALAQMRNDFKKQGNKDTLKMITDNTFLDSSYRPIAGKPVLLVLGVERWEGKSERLGSPIYAGNLRNQIQFKIESGQAGLLSLTDMNISKGYGAGTASLNATVDYKDCTGVWLVLKPNATDDVRVRASFSALSGRKEFEDPGSLVIFDIHPDGADKGQQGKFGDYLQAEHTNRSGADGLVFEHQFFETNPTTGAQELRRVARSLQTSGKTRLRTRNYRNGSPDNMVEGEAGSKTPDEAFELEKKMARLVTHSGPGDQFGYLVDLGLGNVMQVRDGNKPELGAEITIVISGPDGTIIDSQESLSNPQKSGNHFYWGEQDQKSYIQPGNSRSTKISVHKISVLNSDTTKSNQRFREEF